MWAEAASALAGAWAIAKREKDALGYFDFSADAFWRSFAAILFTIPAFVFVMSAQWRMLGELNLNAGIEAATFVLTNALLYLASWVLLPLAMVPATKLLGVEKNYAAFVIVYNWSTVLLLCAASVPDLLYTLHIVPREFAVISVLLIVPLTLWYHFEIARRTLEGPLTVALSVVLLDFSLDIFMSILAERLLPLSSGA